jgi:GNAT superfamily N-acetyltransferase
VAVTGGAGRFDPRGTLLVTRGEYTISDDPARLDHAAIFRLITTVFWGVGLDPEVVSRSVSNSHGFGVFRGGRQVGFARVITDYARFAYVADVVIARDEQGHGLGKWLVETMLGHPALKAVRGWMLSTTDAHELYRRYGFSEADARMVMRRAVPAPPPADPHQLADEPSTTHPPSSPTDDGLGGESACQMHRFYDLDA